MTFPRVKILMPEGGPVVQGTRIYIDGVEQKSVRSATIRLEANGVATLDLEQFASIEIDANMQVSRYVICADCKRRQESDDV